MKNKQIPFPVTKENFPDCWAYVDKRRRTARVMAAAARLGNFLITLLFLALVVFFGCGLLHTQLGGSFSAFLESTGFFMPLWQPFGDRLLSPELSLQQQLLRLAAAAYGISWLAHALLTGLIYLLYHPRKAPLPEGTWTERTALLVKKAQQARDHTYATKVQPSVVATVLGILLLLIVCFWYMFYLKDAAFFTQYLGVFPTKDISVNSLLYMLVLYLVFGILTSLLSFLCRPLYRYHFSMDLVAQAQQAAFLSADAYHNMPADAQNAAMKADAAALREEALALERNGHYGLAKEKLLTAAVCEDTAAMEHYARHCLIGRLNDSAYYWLKRCCSQEDASKAAKWMLLRMRLKMHHNAVYLKPEEAPPSPGQKIARITKTVLGVLWKTFMLAVFVGSLLVVWILFSMSTGSDALMDKLPPAAAEFLAELKTVVSDNITPEPEFIPEEVSSFETPEFTMDIQNARWASECILKDEDGKPVVLCYSQDLGGELRVPFYMEPGQKLRSAGLCSGNIWNIAYITTHVSLHYQTRTLSIAEEYLMGLAPGEYCVILDDWCYFPLIISQTHTFNSTQRGFAGYGNENGWIVNDLDAPGEITLSFYNLGDNPIRELIEATPMANLMNPPETRLDPQFYTISPDGHSVTLSQEYLARQEVGSYATFRVRLANGDFLDMGHLNVLTVQGEEIGLVRLQGAESYSVSGGGDYVATYAFSQSGAPMGLYVSTDQQSNVIVDELADVMGDYVDLENQTITLPADVLKPHLTPGESFYIGFSYITQHGQMAFQNLPVSVTW